MSTAKGDIFLESSLDPDQCQKLAQLFADQFAWSSTPVPVPFTAPVLLFSAKAGGMKFDLANPPDDRITVHEYQSIQGHVPLTCGTELCLSIQVEEAAKASGSYGFNARITGTGAMVQTRTILRNLQPEDFRRMQGTRLPKNMRPEDLYWTESIPIKAPAVAEYLTLSGDKNPLHSDNDYARSWGLEGAIVPGMLIVGLLQTVFAKSMPNRQLVDLRVRFLAPVLVGQAVRFGLLDKSANAAAPEKRLRVFVMGENDIVSSVADAKVTGPQSN